jgi:hypothetical protein
MIVPLAAPMAEGANTALMVQEVFAASELPQVLVWVNPALSVIAFKTNALVPRLATVKALAALGDPTTTFPKVRDAGLSDSGATPLPVRLAV